MVLVLSNTASPSAFGQVCVHVRGISCSKLLLMYLDVMYKNKDNKAEQKRSRIDYYVHKSEMYL